MSRTHSRAVTPAAGVVLLAFMTLLAASAVGAVTLGAQPPGSPAPTTLSLDVDAVTDRIALVHEGGAPLDAGELRIRITVDGEPLAHQPPVLFFTMRGFESGPRGPFNAATERTWTAGETASVRLATTNAPLPESGETVRVEVYADGEPVADLRGTG